MQLLPFLNKIRSWLHSMSEQRQRHSYADLPNEVHRKIDEYVSDSTVGLLGYSQQDERVERVYGSGSLVTIGSVHGVLTAGHVWSALQRDDRVFYISFCIIGGQHYIRERKDRIRAFIPPGVGDICFLGIPPTICGTIKSHRTFVAIDESRCPSRPQIEGQSMVSAGFPLEIQSPGQLHILRYKTHLADYCENSKEADELHLEYNFGNSTGRVPVSLGGMSGGGVWCFKILYNDDSEELKVWFRNTDTRLVGVNFFQTAMSDVGVRHIRAVGPQSIYRGLTRYVANTL